MLEVSAEPSDTLKPAKNWVENALKPEAKRCVHQSVTTKVESPEKIMQSFSILNWVNIMHIINLYLFHLLIIESVSLPSIEIAKSHRDHKNGL